MAVQYHTICAVYLYINIKFTVLSVPIPATDQYFYSSFLQSTNILFNNANW